MIPFDASGDIILKDGIQMMPHLLACLGNLNNIYTMKRSSISLTNKERLADVNRELASRQANGLRDVQAMKITRQEANKQYLIILEIKELIEACNLAGIDFSEVRKIVDNLNTSRPAAAKSTQLKFPR